jgi:hypothetical protein
VGSAGPVPTVPQVCESSRPGLPLWLRASAWREARALPSFCVCCRYGIPKLAPEEHKKFAENFQKVYAAKITEVCDTRGSDYDGVMDKFLAVRRHMLDTLLCFKMNSH